MMRHDAPERYFHTRVKRGPSGLYDTWIILGGRSFELEQLSEKPESLSMRITGTNGQLQRGQNRQSARQGTERHSTDDAAISPCKRSFSLAGDESPRIKLPQHDGQSGGSAGNAGAL